MRKTTRARRLIPLSVFVGLTILVSACRPQGIVARVNGRPIYQRQINQQIWLISKQPAQKTSLKLEQGQAKELANRILANLITTELIVQEAEKAGIKVSQSEIEAQVRQVRTGFSNEKEFKKFLKTRKLTRDSLKKGFRERLLTDRVRQQVASKVKVSDREVSAYVVRNKAVFQEPEKWQLRHILVRTQGEAERLLSDLDGGADFADKAKKISLDQSSNSRGGLIGWLNKTNMGPVLYDVVKDLAPGQTTGMLSFGGGFHFYQLVAKRPAGPMSPTTAKAKARRQLMLQKQQAAWTDWLTEVRQAAVVDKL